MSFHFLSQLITQIEQSPKCPINISSLFQQYKGIDWCTYISYRPLYPQQTRLWNNNAHELVLLSLFPHQSFPIYKNSTIHLLTGQALTNEPFQISLDYPTYYIKNHLQLQSKNDYTTFLMFKNYNDIHLK